MRKISMIVFIFTALVGNIFASNPADLTSAYRLCPVEFFKATYDGGPKWIFANVPVNKSVAIATFCFQNEPSTFRLYKLNMAKRFSSFLETALYTDVIESNGAFSLSHHVAVDLHSKHFGLAAIIPLQSKEYINLGARASLKSFTGFFTFFPGADDFTDNLFGLTFSGIVNVEVAYGSEILTARASKGFDVHVGTIIPEIRTQFTVDDQTYGIGIGFIPKN